MLRKLKNNLVNINVRQAWLDYYKDLGFEEIPSAPLIHPAFPTSFNMSAGLVQIAPIVASKTKVSPIKQCLIQKCIRYFDIKKVVDGIHLSFFEMPGAFEIVDFEEIEVVAKLWRFLTSVIQINPNKIWVTSFDENQINQIQIKQDINSYLKKQFKEKLILGDKKTNFWVHRGNELTNNINLCGPRVEFFYDLRSKLNPDDKLDNPLTNVENFLEIASVLFIKYYIENKDSSVKKIINCASESVIGLERVSSVLEGKGSNLFESSFFSSFSAKLPLAKITSDVQIILDHIKSLIFILSEDTILPDSKSERGIIIRNLIQNFLISCYVLSISPQKYLPILVDEIIIYYKPIYPEIEMAKKIVIDIVLNHEKNFRVTLKKRSEMMNNYLKTNQIENIQPVQKQYLKENFGIEAKLIPLLMKGTFNLNR